jgi:hypothetical protein
MIRDEAFESGIPLDHLFDHPSGHDWPQRLQVELQRTGAGRGCFYNLHRSEYCAIRRLEGRQTVGV